MITLKKTMTAILLASQMLMYINIADAATGGNPLAGGKLQDAFSNIRANKIVLKAICNGDLELATSGCGVTSLNQLDWLKLLRAVPLSYTLGFRLGDTNEVSVPPIANRAVILRRLAAAANADVAGPTLTYQGPAGTYVGVGLFTDDGYIYHPMVSAVGNLVTAGFPILSPNTPVPYSTESIFGGTSTLATPGRYFMMAVAYTIVDGVPVAIELDPRLILIGGAGWTAG